MAVQCHCGQGPEISAWSQFRFSAAAGCWAPDLAWNFPLVGFKIFKGFVLQELVDDKDPQVFLVQEISRNV